MIDLTIKYKQQLRNCGGSYIVILNIFISNRPCVHVISGRHRTTPFCHVLCLGMHCNVMLRFMVQALQDPPLCSNTSDTSLLFAMLLSVVCVLGVFYVLVSNAYFQAETKFCHILPEPVFSNVYGAPELIPRNEFRQSM